MTGLTDHRANRRKYTGQHWHLDPQAHYLFAEMLTAAAFRLESNIYVSK
jgi:hypothetical protein